MRSAIAARSSDVLHLRDASRALRPTLAARAPDSQDAVVNLGLELTGETVGPGAVERSRDLARARLSNGLPLSMFLCGACVHKLPPTRVIQKCVRDRRGARPGFT